MVGNINKAKMKMFTDKDLLLVIILRKRRKEKRKPQLWVKKYCLFGLFSRIGEMLKKRRLF